MEASEVKRTLEKQLELLSERSRTVEDMCLADVTEQMVQIAALLLDREKANLSTGLRRVIRTWYSYQ